MAPKKKTSIKLLTPKFRASFVQVFTPKAHESAPDKPMYSLAMLFDKKAQETPEYKKLVAGIKEIIVKDFDGKVPQRFWNPLQKGDDKQYQGYAGCMFMNAKSKEKPGIVDKDLNDIIDPPEFYSGVYARATIQLFSFDNMGNKGIGVGLQNIQKLADGESLTGRTKATDDFGAAHEDLEEESSELDFG